MNKVDCKKTPFVTIFYLTCPDCRRDKRGNAALELVSHTWSCRCWCWCSNRRWY